MILGNRIFCFFARDAYLSPIRITTSSDSSLTTRSQTPTIRKWCYIKINKRQWWMKSVVFCIIAVATGYLKVHLITPLCVPISFKMYTWAKKEQMNMTFVVAGLFTYFQRKSCQLSHKDMSGTQSCPRCPFLEEEQLGKEQRVLNCICTSKATKQTLNMYKLGGTEKVRCRNTLLTFANETKPWHFIFLWWIIPWMIYVNFRWGGRCVDYRVHITYMLARDESVIAVHVLGTHEVYINNIKRRAILYKVRVNTTNESTLFCNALSGGVTGKVGRGERYWIYVISKKKMKEKEVV